MTTSNEQPAKMPLMKRVMIAVRGGVGGGISAVMVALVVGLLLALAVGGFLGGAAFATQRNQKVEQMLAAQTKAAKVALIKAQKAREELEKELEPLKELNSMQSKDIERLKDEVEHGKVERAAMDKVMTDFKDSLRASAGSAKPEAAPKPGATLKFGNKDCDVQGGAVKSKADVKCLDLKNAIDAMNSGPGGYNKPGAKAEAKESKPESGHK